MNQLLMNKKYVYKSVSIFIFIGLLIVASKNNGFDYEQYIININLTMNASSFLNKMIYAKDALFLAIIELYSVLNMTAEAVMFGMIFISFVLKIIFIMSNRIHHPLLFAISYTLFLSLGLDFNAIRALLALDIFLFYFSYKDNKIRFLSIICKSLSILAHKSMVITVIFDSVIVNRFAVRNKISLVLISIFISFVMPNLIRHVAYLNEYVDNKPSIYVFIPLLLHLTAISTFFIFNKVHLSKDGTVSDLLVTSLLICIFSISSGLYIAALSGRMLEISQYLFLICFVSLRKINRYSIFSYIIFLIPLIYRIYQFDMLSIIFK